MGKWTPNYTDDVLHAKISSLVTGAIRRSANEDPRSVPISYNDFVNDLDTGDSFTTTLLDILVREITERRKRAAGDRRFVSERTARSLRQLADPINIYRARTRHSVRGRRTLVDTDDDEFDTLMETNPAEGTQMSSSELFDAMYNTGTRATSYAIRPRVAATAYAAPTRNEDSATTSPPSPFNVDYEDALRGWTTLPVTTTAPNTARQTTIRRLRSRPDLTFYGRRAALRAQAESEPTEVVTEPRDDPWSRASARRFFALNRVHNRMERLESLRHQASPYSESTDASADDDTISLVNVEGPLAGSSTMPHESGWATWGTVSPRHLVGGPGASEIVRIRRGGVPAPETVLSQAASGSNTGASTLASPPTATEPVPEPLPIEVVVRDSALAHSAEPASYPTPSSVENEHLP